MGAFASWKLAACAVFSYLIGESCCTDGLDVGYFPGQRLTVVTENERKYEKKVL